MILGPETIAPIKSITPESLFGWGGFVFGLGAFGILIWDRITGRTKSIAGVENKIDGLCKQVEDIESTQQVMDAHLSTLSSDVRTLTFEIVGTKGDNGLKSIVRENRERIETIEKHNERLDAVAQHEREVSGGLRRRMRDQVEDEVRHGDE